MKTEYPKHSNNQRQPDQSKQPQKTKGFNKKNPQDQKQNEQIRNKDQWLR